MPVPRPRALREAPSGGGGDEGRWRGPRAEGREPRGVEGTSSRTFFWPGCALCQVRDREGCGPREERASVLTCSPTGPRQKWEEQGLTFEEFRGTCSRPLPHNSVLFPYFTRTPHPNISFKDQTTSLALAPSYNRPRLLAPLPFLLQREGS
jgi:hypothetical protein